MKTFFAVVGIVLDAVLLFVAVLMLLAGYYWMAALCGFGAFGSLVIAARQLRSRPEQVSAEAIRNVWDDAYADDGLSDVERQMLRYGYVAVDEVDMHAAQMIRALSGQSAVLPEHRLLFPPRPQQRQDNPQPKSLGGN